ncbi:MAG: PAS domain-containing sensor histidine kinase [Bacteroidota bacterium]|nr:PAS domain-containing sensor histidine kinase [Bacteroidota bacterium]
MERLCIIICNSLAPEISHILQNGDYHDVTLKSFPAICVGCTITDQRITEIIGDNPDKYSKIVVIVSSCRGIKNLLNLHLKNVEIIHLEQCFEIIFPLPTIYHCINQGNYLVSNGWLRNYNHKIREWGFDAASAKSFFGESIRKILLLETGLPGDYQTNLTALSEYMGVPYDILPIGTSHLKSFLDTIILDWKNEAERKMQNSRIEKLARESADYSLIFNHLKNLIDHTDEQIIIREITSLLHLLLVPEKLVYHQYVNGIETNTTEPTLPNTSFNPEDSITIEITHQNETLGLFEVLKVRFPQFIPRYKPMEQVISQIGGLAISNARRYSELERTRLALSLSEEHFRTMFEQAPLGIALVDSLTGKIKSVNSKFAEIAGRSRDEIRIIDWMSITHPDDIQEDLDNMARLNAGEIAGFQMNKRYLKPDGSIVWINMTIEPITVENKANPFHLCMIEDITERKKAEEQLRLSEALLREMNATKDKFFSIISHDLRGSLASILSLTGLIADNYSEFSQEDLQQFTRSIHKTTESTFNLLQNLLEWSRMQRGLIPFNPEPVNLKAFIGDCDESVQIMAKSKSVGLNVYFPEGLVVMADPNMLKAILRNLIMNAIKFTPRGGRIDLTANIAENRTVWFSVKDTGIGMSHELIENLFRIDKNVSRPGTDSEPSAGLGLILCKEFVEKHGGQIWAESEVEKGSTFYFTIPATV